MSSSFMDRFYAHPKWSDEDSKERAVSLVNSPQVYIYIQYLFIYFSVYSYVCFLIIVQPTH